MITVESASLKNSTLNVEAGKTLKFDDKGRCENVDPEIAIILFGFPGFKIYGMTEEQTQKALDRQAKMREESTATVAEGESKPKHLKGMLSTTVESVAPGSASTPFMVPGGRMPDQVKARIEAAEAALKARESVATVTVPTEKKKKLPSVVLTRKAK